MSYVKDWRRNNTISKGTTGLHGGSASNGSRTFDATQPEGTEVRFREYHEGRAPEVHQDIRETDEKGERPKRKLQGVQRRSGGRHGQRALGRAMQDGSGCDGKWGNEIERQERGCRKK